MALVPAEPLTRSGIAILASRWAAALRNGGIITHLCPVNQSGPGPQFPKDILPVFMGLGEDLDRAQRTIDRVVTERQPLLWERAGYSNLQSGHGLRRLDEIAKAWVLNTELRAETNVVLPSAQLEVAALAIPDLFFAVRRRPVAPYAAFLGRFSESKGAGRLAEVWIESVFPAIQLQLIMAGRGFYTDPATELRISSLSERHPKAIQLTKLMPEQSRAQFLSDAVVTIFPARTDYFPQALGEALATGATVIATDILGHRTLAVPGLTSLAVDVPLNGLAAAVDLVRSNSRATHELKTQGQDLIRRNHSVNATSRRLVALLREY